MSAATPTTDGLRLRSIFAVPGVRGAAVRTGVKPSGDPDLALIRADAPMSAAAVFTTSTAAAAPVHVSRERLNTLPLVRSIVINSGNANALTGARGHEDAERMLVRTEAAAGGPAIVLSTGVIGVPLPIEKVLDGIERAAGELDRPEAPGETPSHADVARAILTTDTAEKSAAVRTRTRRPYTVGGIAKGSGMIHPNMATMLAVIATDAPVAARSLREILGRAVDRSFHEISVDGDQSTNDAVVLLASDPGAGDGLDGEELEELARAVTTVAKDLAWQIVADGEGMSRALRIDVQGAASREDARDVARRIAGSSLVKTALAGGDPNWGRILSAASTAGDAFAPELATLRIGDQIVFERGEPQRCDQPSLERAFSRKLVRIRLDLGRGRHTGGMFTTDFTHDYVEINSAYTT